MITIARNLRIYWKLALLCGGLSAGFWLWSYLDPAQAWTVLWIECSTSTLAIFIGALALLMVGCRLLLCRLKGNVRLCRQGVLIGDGLLYRWEDIRSVSCYRQEHLPVCNITFQDGRQRQVPVYLLGSNFALIQEVFEHPEHWTKLEPGPITGETETQYVSPHVRRRPLLSWDAPQSRYFSPFVVTAGIGALGLLVAFLDEWLPVGVQPVPRIVAGALGFIFAALAVVFFRRWRAERAGRMTPGAGRHGENTT